MSIIKTKFIGGRKYVNVTMDYQDDIVKLKFGYNRKLIDEVKAMSGARWNPEGKFWTVSNNNHNLTVFKYLMGEDVFEPFDRPLIDFKSNRPLYTHQHEMTASGLTRHFNIWAVEMGCGKTLAAIELMEQSGFEDWWYVAPRSALASVELEFEKWECKVSPTMLTYEGLKKEIKDWRQGSLAPHGVIFDESSRIKNATAQRSQAAMQMADGIREDWGKDGYVILMSGSPAPKSPVDWWHQAEVAFPGFIKEGNEKKLRTRLSIIQSRDNGLGQKYPHHVGWKDEDGKCGVCGEMEDSPYHDINKYMILESPEFDEHEYQPCINEVTYMYERLEGLVLVKHKKDCLDLPDKQYRIIRVTPSANTMRLAKFIISHSKRAIEALSKLRELSDGFQYAQEDSGEWSTCPTCNGTGEVDSRISPEDSGELSATENDKVSCPKCEGVGTIPKMVRNDVRTETPKDNALIDLLDQHEEIGRIVISCGFTASIDRVCDLVKEQGWDYIRIDSGCCRASFTNNMSIKLAQTYFQRAGEYGNLEKIALVMNPKSGGMGLTLTESPSMVYYSNPFDGEARIQSEDRIHRAGMDINRGATIYDIIHLPTDELVMENLKNKRKLQSMTMGELQTEAEKLIAEE